MGRVLNACSIFWVLMFDSIAFWLKKITFTLRKKGDKKQQFHVFSWQNSENKCRSRFPSPCLDQKLRAAFFCFNGLKRRRMSREHPNAIKPSCVKSSRIKLADTLGSREYYRHPVYLFIDTLAFHFKKKINNHNLEKGLYWKNHLC